MLESKLNPGRELVRPGRESVMPKEYSTARIVRTKFFSTRGNSFS